jgi:hypothetical protein
MKCISTAKKDSFCVRLMGLQTVITTFFFVLSVAHQIIEKERIRDFLHFKLKI